MQRHFVDRRIVQTHWDVSLSPSLRDLDYQVVTEPDSTIVAFTLVSSSDFCGFHSARLSLEEKFQPPRLAIEKEVATITTSSTIEDNDELILPFPYIHTAALRHSNINFRIRTKSCTFQKCARAAAIGRVWKAT